jgi:hypothetical protein
VLELLPLHHFHCNAWIASSVIHRKADGWTKESKNPALEGENRRGPTETGSTGLGLLVGWQDYRDNAGILTPFTVHTVCIQHENNEANDNVHE